MSAVPFDSSDSTQVDELHRAIGGTKLWFWLALLEGDLDSAQIAHEGYSRAKTQTWAPDAATRRTAQKHMFHNAKTFVCAVRRIGRLLKSFAALSTGPGDLPPSAVKLVKQVWRKNRVLLESYVGPRDVIEHVDGEMRGKPSAETLFVANNIENDRYQAAPGKEADLSESALTRLLAIRQAIYAGLWEIAEEEGQ